MHTVIQNVLFITLLIGDAASQGDTILNYNYTDILKVGNSWVYETLIGVGNDLNNWHWYNDPERYLTPYIVSDWTNIGDTLKITINFINKTPSGNIIDSGSGEIKILNGIKVDTGQATGKIFPLKMPMNEFSGSHWDDVYGHEVSLVDISPTEEDTLYTYKRNGMYYRYEGSEEIVYTSSIGILFRETYLWYGYEYDMDWIILREFNGDQYPYGMAHVDSMGYFDNFVSTYNEYPYSPILNRKRNILHLIKSISASEIRLITAFDLQGRGILSTKEKLAFLSKLHSLARGIYIIKMYTQNEVFAGIHLLR